jgi:uncharacterized RDD family membrane protein YckC
MPTLTLRTPEGITLEREIAGPGSRLTAAALDALLIGLVYALLVLTLAVISAVDVSGLSSLVIGILLAGIPLVLAVYHFCFHAFAGGQTPGKRLVGLRVTSADGYPATLTQNLLRSALWPVDVFMPVPLPFMLGVTIITLTEKRQRIGDLVAGTLVVRDERAHVEADPFHGERWSNLPRKTLDLHPGVAAHFEDDDFEFLRELLAREDMHYDERRRLIGSAASFYARRLQLPKTGSPEVFLKELFLFLRESRAARA